MAIVNRFNVNNKQVTLDADIIENMSANDVSYNSSLQYDENTIGDKLSELEKEVIYDVTANNDGITFSSLSELLSSENLSTLIPTSVRHGGMSIRFVNSSDKTYVQYRLLLSDSFTNSQLCNPDNWHGVDKEPKPGSKNVAESGGIVSMINKNLHNLVPYTAEEGFYITDENGNVIIRLDVLDTNSEIGEHLKANISKIATEIINKVKTISDTAEEGFYVCNNYGEVIASFVDDEWTLKGIAKKDINPITSRSMIFGIVIDNSTGNVTRFADTKGLNSNYYVGQEPMYNRDNDFDNCYPWCDIKTCNVKIENGVKVITYEGEEGFTRDGSNGDVMVEIPKFYTFREVKGDLEYICISGTEKAGFILEPAFKDSNTGEVIDRIYVGAYMSHVEDGHHTSKSGIVNQDVWGDSRISMIEARSAGEHYDFFTLQAIQKLFIIEFGTIDTSSIFAGFGKLPFWYEAYPFEDSDGPVNEGYFYCNEYHEDYGGSSIKNLFVGATITISEQQHLFEGRLITEIGDTEEILLSNNKKVWRRYIKFTGEPIELIGNLDGTDHGIRLYATQQLNGWTDSIPYHTGRALVNQNPISDQFKYRGMESLWSNIGTLVDGIYIESSHIHVNPGIKANYGATDADEDTFEMSYLIPKFGQNTEGNPNEHTYDYHYSVCKKMGYDRKHPTIMLPVEITSDGTGGYHTFYADLTNANFRAGYRYTLVQSMGWDGAYGNGLFMHRFWQTQDTKSALFGARMIYRNI